MFLFFMQAPVQRRIHIPLRDRFDQIVRSLQLIAGNPVLHTGGDKNQGAFAVPDAQAAGGFHPVQSIQDVYKRQFWNPPQ